MFIISPPLELLLVLKSWSGGLWLGCSYYCWCFGFFLVCSLFCLVFIVPSWEFCYIDFLNPSCLCCFLVPPNCLAVLHTEIGDNSVHLHDWSPFWVSIFITFNKKTTMFTVLCRHAHSDWKKALKHF